MRINGKEYRTIWFEKSTVKIIDQTKLPHQLIIKDLKKVQDAINAIKSMEVRGAPLIGATAAYGLVLSIIIMATMANAVSKMISKYGWIAWLGLIAILYVALELIYSDLKILI